MIGRTGTLIDYDLTQIRLQFHNFDSRHFKKFLQLKENYKKIYQIISYFSYNEKAHNVNNGLSEVGCKGIEE